MSDDLANSTAEATQATGSGVASATPEDSTPPSQPGDQEQGGRSKSNPESRINGLMATLGERTTERDEARAERDRERAEVEDLRDQLAQLTAPTDDEEAMPTQQSLMYPPEPAPDQQPQPEDGNEFPPIRMGINPQRGLPGVPSSGYNPVYGHLREQGDIGLMKQQLNAMGREQVVAAKDEGTFD